jgi:hypothetical protein
MIESPMPQDILKYKAKFIGNFSARETLWLTIGGIACMCGYFLFPSISFINNRMGFYGLLGLPFFAIGFIRPLGQPLERVLFQIIFDNFIVPPIRKKETHYPEFEKYEHTKKWLLNEKICSLEGEIPGEVPAKKRKKKSKKKEQTVKIKGSKEFKAIK